MGIADSGKILPASGPESLLTVRDLHKSFAGVHALSGVSLEIYSGEVHALVGENGAGKSTLIKILSGYYTPDSGEVRMSGQRLPPGDVAASEAAGIAVIHQESTAFPHLGVEDNIFAGREPRRFLGLFLDRRRIRNRALELLATIGEKIDLDRPVGELPVAQQQLVALARALSSSSRLLIMDEPTSSLSARETRVLFDIIHQLKASGVSILYISHRLDEIFEIAERVTVLRDGQWVETRLVADVTRDSLIRSMVGRELGEAASTRGDHPCSGSVLLDVKGLSRDGAFEDVSFVVHTGETVGLAGLVGAGRSDVARAIFGIDRPTRGEILVSGKSIEPGSVRASMHAGIALVPEDRQHQGLVLGLSVHANMVMAIRPTLARRRLIRARVEEPVVSRLMADLAVRASSSLAPVESLSGGNQQKVVLGKWLATSPKVLVLDEPTKGVDVGAKAEVHNLIRKLTDGGSAVLVISSDLPEVLSICDRILVMRAGRIVGELAHSEATQEKVLELTFATAEAEDQQ